MKVPVAVVTALLFLIVTYLLVIGGLWVLAVVASKSGQQFGAMLVIDLLANWFVAPAAGGYVAISGTLSTLKRVPTDLFYAGFIGSVVTLGFLLVGLQLYLVLIHRINVLMLVAGAGQIVCVVLGAMIARRVYAPPGTAAQVSIDVG